MTRDTFSFLLNNLVPDIIDDVHRTRKFFRILAIRWWNVSIRFGCVCIRDERNRKECYGSLCNTCKNQLEFTIKIHSKIPFYSYVNLRIDTNTTTRLTCINNCKFHFRYQFSQSKKPPSNRANRNYNALSLITFFNFLFRHESNP